MSEINNVLYTHNRSTRSRDKLKELKRLQNHIVINAFIEF